MKEVVLSGMVRANPEELETNNFEFFIVKTDLAGERKPLIKRYRLDHTFNGYWTTGITWMNDEKLLVHTSTDKKGSKLFLLDVPEDEIN
jgi:hypothetical protein